MTELNERGDFEENLEKLLATVDDQDLRQILREHTGTIMQVAKDSTKQQRAPLRKALEALIEQRVEEKQEQETEEAE